MVWTKPDVALLIVSFLHKQIRILVKAIGMIFVEMYVNVLVSHR